MTREGNTSSRWVTVLMASLLVLGTACAAGLREPSLGRLVSEQDERAQAAQFKRKAAHFRLRQQLRLERMLTRLLLDSADPPDVTVEVAGCDAVNAFVGGRRIHVCLGMLRFVKSDDELAVVLGHEMGHLPTSADHALLGGIQGEGEREADIRGLLYAHRAGYDIRVGAQVFERMAVELSSEPGKPDLGDHPSHAERMILAEEIARLLERSGAERDPKVSLRRLHHLMGLFDDLL